MASRPTKPFTGRHITAILVAGFGVVMCVNFYMASLAVGGFHGTVVDNSYVASQKFNDWLGDAAAARALGWSAKASREEAGHVIVETSAVPPGAVVTASLRRPIGEQAYASLEFTALGDGRFLSTEPVAPNRWIIRLFISADGQQWAEESELAR